MSCPVFLGQETGVRALPNPCLLQPLGPAGLQEEMGRDRDAWRGIALRASVPRGVSLGGKRLRQHFEAGRSSSSGENL